MLILRIVGLGVALALALLVILFMASGDRKYLRYAWWGFIGALAFVLLVLVAFALQRIVAMA